MSNLINIKELSICQNRLWSENVEMVKYNSDLKLQLLKQKELKLIAIKVNKT